MSYFKENKPNLFITGASGFLGTNAIRYFQDISEVSAQFNKTKIASCGIKTIRMDLANEKEIRETSLNIKPDWVIHMASITSPDECEKDKNYAKKINIDGTRHIVNYFNDKNIPVIYISTDLVFDGNAGNYNEDNQPNPISYYGETKLLAEQITLSALDNNTVLRIALSYGKSYANAKGGFIDGFINSLNNNQNIYLFTDQTRTPLYSGDFCEALKNTIEKKQAKSPEAQSRIYHISGYERITRHAFGEMLASVFGKNRSLITPTLMRTTPSIAKRGKDCSLDISKAKKELEFTPCSILDNLKKDFNIRKEEISNANINSH